MVKTTNSTENLIKNFISEALSKPTSVIGYHISQALENLFPDKAIIKSTDDNFSFYEYAQAGRCAITPFPLIHNQFGIYWNKPNTKYSAVNCWFDIEWQNHSLSVVQVGWLESCGYTTYRAILAENKTIAEEFFSAVCDWATEVRDEILVFEDDYWGKNKELFQSIKNCTFENLILPQSLKQQLQDDFKQFFDSQEVYEKYGVPWKRGAIFIGDPGNGKTHAVKAIINSLNKPCLYVKSCKSQYYTEQHNLHTVFERTRETIPCILVLEDLDSLINDDNRSYFLNELDGFASNTGLVVIATTNHPERLDSAILERPSRFDRKYYFELPAEEERFNYISFWNDRLKENLHLSEKVIAKLVKSTDGFSFAYLKELLLSSIMHWISQNRSTTIKHILAEQTKLLRKQMKKNGQSNG